MKTRFLTLAAAGLLATAGTVQAQEWTANAGFNNNYIWRGLTQTINDPSVSGGIDVAFDGGFYAGTWASNVSYAADDVFSYEHDLYAGFAGATDGGLVYDVGFLYYNYDEEAEFDFSELYGSIGIGGFTLGANLLVDTESKESDFRPGADFGFGEAFYVYADYFVEISNGLELGFHIGHHEGDFSEAFNGVPGAYIDYSISLSKDGFSFMITDTDLDDAGPDALDNDEIKFVVSYGMDFEL